MVETFEVVCASGRAPGAEFAAEYWPAIDISASLSRAFIRAITDAVPCEEDQSAEAGVRGRAKVRRGYTRSEIRRGVGFA